MDYQKELEKYPDASAEDKKELEKLASMQKDIAIAGSAEDFIRHPFFKTFENKMNEMIADARGGMSTMLKNPDVTLGQLQSFQAGIDKIVELKAWMNSFVIKGRVAKQSIEIYEQETESMNDKIQAAIEKAAQE